MYKQGLINIKGKSFLFYYLQLRQLASFAKTKEQNYYDVLGVNKAATAKEIKLAYYKKCKLLHPDNNKNDPSSHTKFIALNKAYSVLSQNELRKNYDSSLYNQTYHPNFNQNFRSTTHNSNYQWRDIEYERFYRYSQERNSYNANQNSTSSADKSEFSSPFRVMFYLILGLAAFEVYLFRQIYDHDMNQLHSDVNFNAMNAKVLKSINSEINNADIGRLEEQIRLHKEREMAPLVRKYNNKMNE